MTPSITDFKRGTHIRVKKIPSYFDRFLTMDLLRIRKGIIGSVIGTSATGKVAVEFAESIWAHVGEIDFSTDCHGKGSKFHCLYFPPECLELVYLGSDTDFLKDPEYHAQKKKLDDEACQLTYQADRRRLLLLATF